MVIYSSGKIAEPTLNLVKDLRETIFWLEGNSDTRDYEIRLGKKLYNTLKEELCPLDYPSVPDLGLFLGYKYVEDNTIGEDCYRIYEKDKSIPIKLTSVKTLTEWFNDLPLIHKIDHYNSHIKIIANNLK